MAAKPQTLALAAFLDSDPGARLADLAPNDVRRIAEAFLEACYQDLGKPPEELDGEELRAILTALLPGRLAPQDPLAERVVPTLEVFFDHLETTRTVTQVFELRQALATTEEDFLQAVRTGEGVRYVQRETKPFVHGAKKLSRNDPCSCGSGKKYKKCHGKNA